MNISRTLRFLLLLLLPILAACGQSTTYKTVSEGTLKAGDIIPVPTGDVVLTMDGMIGQTNSGNTLQFDMATLESIGLVQYHVDDPFVKKNILYSGVLLSQLLKVAGADSKATTLTLRALDDYSTDMKIEDVNKWPVILATQADGTYMPIDKNGPIITVWPFNDFPDDLDHLTYDSLWIWSLAKITVK